RQRHEAMGLGDVVRIRGWISLEELIEVYARTHCSIVPTRNTMAEGLTQTSAEAILTCRPVITNPVNPALEVLGPACVGARTNDIDSYVDGVMRLIEEPDYYKSLQRACPALQEQFYDRSQGLAAVLRRAVEPCLAARPGHRVDVGA